MLAPVLYAVTEGSLNATVSCTIINRKTDEKQITAFRIHPNMYTALSSDDSGGFRLFFLVFLAIIHPSRSQQVRGKYAELSTYFL